MDQVTLRLPWPPSINHYYGYSRKTGARYLTVAAKLYRVTVCSMLLNSHRFGDAKLAMLIDLFPLIDAGDADNRAKGILDALQHARIFNNDRQVRDLRIRFKHPIPHGAVEVTLWEIGKCLS